MLICLLSLPLVLGPAIAFLEHPPQGTSGSPVMKWGQVC